MSNRDVRSTGSSGQGPARYVQAYRFQFFVPLLYNVDTDDVREQVPPSKFFLLHDELTRRFGGFTWSKARPPIVCGVWADAPGAEPVSDECFLYDTVIEPLEECCRPALVPVLDSGLAAGR